MAGFKTYKDDEGEEQEFTVFIIHGHSAARRALQRYIKNELDFNAEILQDYYAGTNILDKFKKAIWENADCAIAIMSPDDRLEGGNFRARQNVIFEIGYCQGIFDSYYGDEYDFEPVMIIKEKSIDFAEVSDLLGLEVFEYSEGNISSVFRKLKKALNSIYDELAAEEE